MADVEKVNNGYEENDIPYDVLWLDIEHTNGKRYFTWDRYAFGEPKKMIDDIASYGRKMVTIIDPHIKKDNNYYVYKEAHDKKYFIQNQDRSEYSGWCWPGTSAYLDFCRPEVREYWANLFLFEKYEGSTPQLFTWNDMNEPSVFDGPEVSMPRTNLHFHADLNQPWEHRDVHNLYGFYVQMATYEGHLKRASNTRPFVLSRAFFAGSQRYGAVWTGDNAATWGHLKASIPMLLSHSIAGLPFIGDVGGFFGNPDAELLWRWYQLGAFQPFFRAHAHKETNRREPWLFGDDYTHKINDAVSERYRILPYIYTLFYHSSNTGEPINRPVWFEFPEDKTSFGRDDVFLLGDGILVSCISQSGVRGRQPLLLPGTANDIWYNYYPPYAAYNGGSHGYADVTNKIPVFLRGGSIISLRERKRRSSSQMKNDPITLLVAVNKEGKSTGTFYWDDGESLDYQHKGNRELRKFTLENNILKNERVGAEQFNSKAPTIERIILIGVQTSGAKYGERELTLQTVQGAKIIRKPLLSLNESWKIVLN